MKSFGRKFFSSGELARQKSSALIVARCETPSFIPPPRRGGGDRGGGLNGLNGLSVLNSISPAARLSIERFHGPQIIIWV